MVWFAIFLSLLSFLKLVDKRFQLDQIQVDSLEGHFGGVVGDSPQEVQKSVYLVFLDVLSY